MVKDAEAHAEDDRRQREIVETRNAAENAAYQAERQVDRDGRLARLVLQGGDRGGHQGRARQPRVEDVELLKQKTDALQGAFHKVSEQMYAAAQQQAAAAGNGAAAVGEGAPADSDEEEVVDAEVVDGEERS
jgi:molecular chaperone DnaK